MKLMSNARVNSLQVKIRAQALAIDGLEQENRKQAERIAGLEALLYSVGALDKDAFLAEPEEKAWLASLALAGVDERTREREENRCAGTSSVSCADTFPVRGEGKEGAV